MLELEENGMASACATKATDYDDSFDENFLKACDSGPFTIAIYRLKDLKYVFVNKTWSDVTGIRREGSIGKPVYQCRSINMLDSCQQALLREKCRNEETFNLQFAYLDKGGKLCRAHTVSSIIRFRGERCRLLVTTEVAGPFGGEDSGGEQCRLLQAFASSLADFSMILDESGRVVRVFPSGKLENVFDGIVQGESFAESLPGFLGGSIGKLLSLSLAENGTASSEVKIADKGKEMVVKMTAVPLQQPIRGRRTVALHIQDMTLQGTLQETLRITNDIYNRSVYLNQLLTSPLPEEQINRQLNEYGIDTEQEYCCYIVRIEKNSADSAIIKPASNQSILAWFVEQVEGWVWKYREDIVLLVPVKGQDLCDKDAQAAFARRLAQEVEGAFPFISVKMGISGLSGSRFQFRALFDKAYRALKLFSIYKEADHLHYADLGLYEVAFQLLNDKNTLELVEKTIGKIHKYDQSRDGSLLQTLERILEDESLKMVAKRLFIHHNTVIWRKQRIEKLLGLTLDKFENRALLSLHLKIWKLTLAGVR